MSKLSEQIRKYVSCPQLGNEHYGEWGALPLKQRTLIAQLCDEMEDVEEAIKRQTNNTLLKKKHHREKVCEELRAKIKEEIYKILEEEFDTYGKSFADCYELYVLNGYNSYRVLDWNKIIDEIERKKEIKKGEE